MRSSCPVGPSRPGLAMAFLSSVLFTQRDFITAVQDRARVQQGKLETRSRISKPIAPFHVWSCCVNLWQSSGEVRGLAEAARGLVACWRPRMAIPSTYFHRVRHFRVLLAKTYRQRSSVGFAPLVRSSHRVFTAITWRLYRAREGQLIGAQ